jgi:tRNA pseudouridine38-40 synthase
LARYKAVIEYDGTDFAGFQRQIAAAGRTVQGELETALATMNHGQPVTVHGAGRTDSGVHASGQVVAFNLNWPHGDAVLLKALNATVPKAISVQQLAECDEEFHPRYGATGRRYRYRIHNAPTRSALQARFTWHVWPALNVQAMTEAATHLLGRKDFAAFGSAPDEGGHTVREVREARWDVQAGGELLDFYIGADAFLFRMVRTIVGTLKLVGAGVLSVDGFASIVASQDRSQSAAPAPPQGLCLIEVMY